MLDLSPNAPTTTNESGGKQSHLPCRADLFPPRAFLAVSEVLHHGAEKYGASNWRKIPTSDHLNHALTHVMAWLADDQSDDHLAHAACRILFALDQELRPTIVSEPMPPEEKDQLSKSVPYGVLHVRRTRVYIAGPITIGNVAENVQRAADAGTRLLEYGYSVLVPHLSAYMGGAKPEANAAGIGHETWLASDLSWVDCADVVLRLPGDSRGADIEVEFAEARGIPVVYSEMELMDEYTCTRSYSTAG